MRLYGAIEKVEPLNDGTVRVHGVVSTENRDDQDEIVMADAMRAAIPDYMRFPSIREMHQLSAVGTALEMDVGDDKITRVVAHVVDPTAIVKIRNKVYRGFSIGGRVTQRKAGDPKTITGLHLTEVSCVDRPANPDAVFEMWKASAQGEPGMNGLVTLGETEAGKALAALPHTADGVRQRWLAEDGSEHLTKAAALARNEEISAAPPGETSEPVDKAVDNEPVESSGNAAQTAIDAALKAIETAGDALGTTLEHTEKESAGDGAKPYGDVAYADPGYQSDGKKRYPIDTAAHIRAAWNYINKPANSGKYNSDQASRIKGKIVAAWKRVIDKDGPPSAEKISARDTLAKSLWDIGRLAQMVADQMELKERFQLAALLTSTAQVLRNLVAEETAEAMAGTEIDEPVDDEPVMSLSLAALDVMTDAVKSFIPETDRAEALVSWIQKVGARHDAAHQAQMDIAAYAIRRGMEIGPLRRAEMVEAGMAHKAVLDAGAAELRAEREMLTNSNPTAGSPTQNSTVNTAGAGVTGVPNATGASPASPHPGRAQQGTQKAAAAEPTLLMIEGMVKRGAGHMALFDIGHDQMDAISGGATCKEGGGKPGYLSTGDMALLHKAHGHLMNLGVKCAAAEAETDNPPPGGPVAISSAEAEGQGTAITAGGAGTDRGEPGKNAAVDADDLAKVERVERLEAQNATLVKTINDMVPMLERMSKRVEDIAQQEMPPRAIARVTGSITKSVDNRMPGDVTQPISQEDVAKAFAEMDPETQTLTLIKAAKQKPMMTHGIHDGPGPWRPPVPPAKS
jgi:hypothetical protein